MRQEFVEAETQEEAEDKAPWAEFFADVEGGYMCFESREDYYLFLNQR